MTLCNKILQSQKLTDGSQDNTNKQNSQTKIDLSDTLTIRHAKNLNILILPLNPPGMLSLQNHHEGVPRLCRN